MYEGERVISWSLHFVSSHCFSCGSCRQYEDDDQVLADNELQEFANELSADGTHGDFAGLGKVTNMLWHFMQKRDLYFWASLEKRDFFLQTTFPISSQLSSIWFCRTFSFTITFFFKGKEIPSQHQNQSCPKKSVNHPFLGVHWRPRGKYLPYTGVRWLCTKCTAQTVCR